MANLIIAFPRAEDGKGIRNLLTRHGFSVHAVCTSGAQAISMADELGSGVLICGYRLSDMLYAEVVKNLPRGFEVLIVGTQARIAECAGSGLMFLVAPLKTQDLLNTVSMLAMNAERWRRSQRQIRKKRDQKETETIRRAKEVLMNRNHMTEQEAHRYIQKTSMDNGTNMAETAEMILRLM